MAWRKLICVGVGAAALLAAGWTFAQTPPARPDAPPPSAPIQPPPPAGEPTRELPPQEVAPPQAPAAEVKSPERAQAPAETEKPDAADGGDDKDKPKAKAEEPVSDPGKRQVYGGAVIQALDKITAESMRFAVKAGQPVRWKGLVFTLRTCKTSAPGEPVRDSMAFVQVRSDPHAQSTEASREIFRGWMFASSPGLHPLRHPVYDAWLIGCRA